MTPARTIRAIALAVSCGVVSAAEARVRVIETDPAGPAVLDNWQHLSLHLTYTSDQPIHVRAQPYFEGKKVPAINGGSPLYNAGSGTAFFWVSFTEARKIDKVVVTGETSGGRVVAETSLPLDVTWTGRTSSVPQAKAGWVESMEAQRALQAQEASDAFYNGPFGLLLGALGSLVMAAPLAYIALQVVTLWRLRGGWRRAAALPLIPMACVLVYTVIAAAAGSNLFPLVFIFTSVPGSIYLFVLLFLGGRAPTSSATPSPDPSL